MKTTKTIMLLALTTGPVWAWAELPVVAKAALRQCELSIEVAILETGLLTHGYDTATYLAFAVALRQVTRATFQQRWPKSISCRQP